MMIRLNTWIAVVVVICTVISPVVRAAESSSKVDSASVRVRDIALARRGHLAGQIIDAQGQPMRETSIRFRRFSGESWKTQSDAAGRFSLNGLSGGVYQVVAADSVTVCRFWAHHAAPPMARSELLLVRGETVRGQGDVSSLGVPQAGLGTGMFGGAIAHGLSNPWVVSGLIAAGVAVPIAVANDRDDAS